ncbi:uncharacterized protein LOC120332892 isoform X2 [Styela clava]
MKVICAGMSKSGTKSMHSALEELGYTVCDFPDAFFHFNTNYNKFAIEGWSSEEFKSMYKDFDSVVASPVYYFWEELMEAFPEAKVILMVRENDETWYKSAKKQMDSFKGLHRYYYPFLSPTWRKFASFWNGPCGLSIGPGTTRTINFTMINSPELPFKLVYRKHIAHVTHACPKDRLLVYNCKFGWGPLCEFLGKPLPDKKFPWINKKGEFANMLWEMPTMKQAQKEMLTNASILLAVSLCFGVYLMKIK